MALAYKYRTAPPGQTEATEVLTESMEVETFDVRDVRLDLGPPPVTRTVHTPADCPRPEETGGGASAMPALERSTSEDSGSLAEAADVILEADCDQEGLIQELHPQELTPFEREEEHRQRKQKKKAKRKKIRKRLWRAVRTTWKFLKRGFSGYAPTPGIVNSFTWGVRLPPELFKTPPPNR